MKFKKKNLIWSLALSTFAISAATLIACSQQESPTPNPTPTPPKLSDPGQPPATDPGTGKPGSSKPGSREVGGGLGAIDPGRERIEHEPGFDDLPGLANILNDPKYKRQLSHTSNLAALDTDITVTRYANYNGNGVQNTANNNPFVRYGSDAYNIVKNDHYETLEDYSLRVSITNPDKKTKSGGPSSALGSAWILDFIKKEGESYPLTWFFGSNLHVFKEMRLPKADGTYSSTPGHSFSFLIPKDEQWKEFGEYKTLTNYPELFFSGQNFLGDRISINEQAGAPDYLRKDLMNYSSFKDYAKDFAIVKVQFKDEAEAKAITRNFATKYTTPKIKFDKKSILEKTGDEIAKETKIFALGYPGDSSKPTINKRDNDVNPNTGSSYSSLISGYMITNNYGEKIPGVYDTMYINGAGNSVSQYTELAEDGKTVREVEWQGKKAHFPLSIEIGSIDYDRFGLGIGIDNNNLPPGASGSLIIDNDYKVVGVQWGYDGTSQTGLIDPLVSSELKNPDGTKVFYDYDLIHGRGSDQTRSYKSLLTELLNKTEYKQKNAKSWLLGDEITTS
ncbi:MIP family Ig-specific serine endopeptidase [Mycoplasmopsis agassizii]|uniref:DUF31 domain-containing protein n=1 Tax=Mycoplasmopsis agassizii TaxID=33922 RepID=A0ABX4H598_9BACT|nr:hypothetical protein [Mycoplasmopsis agassizii]PAF55074.1 hypothetical protein CJF60_00075 [Mycoplasmopsis agassizii]SMC19094.1 Putative peptidase [Mycoplasmopsis agassizii]